MVITIEPGVYFIQKLIDGTKGTEKEEFINYQTLEKYMSVGGVRIEDDVYVTKDGHELLTCCPRSVEEIEKCMAGLEWKDK